MGLFLFIIHINKAGINEHDKKIGKRSAECVNKRKKIKTGHWKYVDDLTVAAALDLKKYLKWNTTDSLERP